MMGPRADQNSTVKGAVRMPPPQEQKQHFNIVRLVLPCVHSRSGADQTQRGLASLAPKTHFNTLDSGPGSEPRSSDAPRPSYAHGQPPPSKRLKKAYLGARSRAPVEDIVESEQDARSRTEHQGSQTSFSHSVSPGLPEYQIVEASTRREIGRSNRRNRRPTANRHTGLPIPTKQSRVCNEKIYEFDELAPALKPAAQQQRTARLVASTTTKPSAIIRDAADDHILGKQVRANQQPRGSNKGKKRSSHEITGDVVELAEDDNGKETSRTNAGPPAELPIEDSATHNPPSLSRRGDLNPTKWAKKPDTPAVRGVRVYSAVCHPNLRYLPGDGQPPCFLRPEATGLRVFAEDGSQAAPYDWLKITEKAKSLLHHPESNYVKISQALDQASPTKIGGLMVLGFFNKSDASWVVEWVRKNLKVDVIQEKDRYGWPPSNFAFRIMLTVLSGKLVQIYDKVDGEVTKANGRTWERRLSYEEPVLPRRPVDELPDRAPTTRTPLRQQMRVSAKSPSLPRAEPSSQLVASGSRSLRTRQYAERTQKFEASPSPVILRWTDEHPEWSKDWKMPLVFHRTTVNKEDIERLDDGQYLNDNLIGFGLKYLFEKFSSRHPELNRRVYVHNSFFYEKLKAGRGAINYDGVKGWTAKVDLLSYDYIVVPVCENLHWWVAIICNPGKLDPDTQDVPGKTGGSSKDVEDQADEGSCDVQMTDVTDRRSLPPSRAATTGDSSRLPTASPGELDFVKSDIVDLISDDKNASIDLTLGAGTKQGRQSKFTPRRYNPEDPRIITLDSMGHTHSPAVAHLKKYLLAEFEHKRGKIITDVPAQVGMKAVNIPVQNNYFDCGVYLLGYIQQFVENPDRFIQLLLRKEIPEWDFSASALRTMWRDTIQVEHKMYQDAQLSTSGQKREASAAKRTPNGSASLSARPSKTREIGNEANKRGDRVVPSGPPSLSKTPNTPARQEVHEVDDSDTEPVRPAPRPQSKESISSTSSTSVPFVEGLTEEEEGLDDDDEEEEPLVQEVLVLEPEENVLPSIEPTEDEPRFISTLPDSRPNSPELDCVKEVPPKTFYQSTSAKSQTRGSLSSPAATGHRGWAKKAQPLHTASRFAVADGPVVEKAVMLRNHSDPIDLTE